MKIIKEFAEFKEGPKDTVLWSVEVKSHANTNGLTDVEIGDIFEYHNHEEYTDFKTDFNKKMSDEYNKYAVAKWQLAKTEEIERLFHDNIKYSIKDDVVYVTTKFEISFTDSFDKGDVLGWTEGFNRIAKLVPMIHMYHLRKGGIK